MRSTFLFICTFITMIILFAGCSDNLTTNPVSDAGSTGKTAMMDETQLRSGNNALQTELANVRAATAKYQNIEKAIADGYADIDLYVPHMGWHFMNSGLLDADFDMEKPELLVYANKPNGGFMLVAVEYAVPLALSPDAPEGFTGSEDVWEVNSEFGLWTLHAWVWYNNPDGMFNPYNPRVE